MKKRVFLRNLLVLALALLVPLYLVVIISLNYYEQSMKDREVMAAETELTLLGYATDNMLYLCSGIATQIKNDTQLMHWLGSMKPEQTTYSAVYPMFKNWINYTEPLINCGSADSVYLYLDRLEVVLSTDGLRYFPTMRDMSWLKIYEENKPMLSTMDFFTCARKGIDGGSIISCLTPLLDNQSACYGVLIINISPAFLKSLSGRSSYESSALYLLNENGNQFYSSNGSALNDLFGEEAILRLASGGTAEMTSFENEQYRVIAKKSAKFDWRFFQIIKESDFLAALSQLRHVFYCIFVAAFLIAIAFALFYAAQNYRPIATMVSIIDTYNESGVVQCTPKRHSDIHDHIIYNLINALIEKNNMRIKVAQLEVAEKEAQLHAIQSRINPHFLYNSLDVINWMIIRQLGPANDVSRVIKAMADNFRSILSDNRLIVPLNEEMSLLKRYIEFLCYVDYRHLEVTCQMEDSVESVPVPRLLLQPLLENAYVHGLDNAPKPKIHVLAKKRGGELQIFVVDNGKGLSASFLSELNEALRSGSKAIRSGASGLCNVNSRLILRYGPEFRLHVFSRESRGTAIRIRIPIDGDTPR